MDVSASKSCVSGVNSVTAYVVGPQNMVSEAICFFINSKLGYVCNSIPWDELQSVPSSRDDKSLLILVDYETLDGLGNSASDLERMIGQMGKKSIILYNFQPKANIRQWIAAGVVGFLLKNDSAQTMVNAIKLVMCGQIWIPRQAMILDEDEFSISSNASRRQAYRLTKREREILAIVAAGSTNSEVADKLYISPHTVKVHIQNIFKKIGVPNRVKATIWAHNNLDSSC
jgi:LuxR family transcriptional regulator of csgAB operon